MRAKKLLSWRALLGAALAISALTLLVWPNIPAQATQTGAEAAAASSGSVTVCLVTKDAPTRERTVNVAPWASQVLFTETLSYAGPCSSYGPPSALGNGTVRTYAQIAGTKPLTVGFVFPKATLTGMPTTMTDGHHCYDMNADGTVDEHTECVGGHERPLELPSQLTSLPGMPLKWALLNYNPMGHGPEHIYDTPHIDFHMYTQPKAERDAIRSGPCGLAINCDDYATATKPVPPQFLPQDYQDNGVAEAAMGNHLVDMNSPEWSSVAFTQTFIYGAYDSKISFLEPMITKAWLEGIATGVNPSRCWPIKQPQQWQIAGWYPQEYCIDYRANRGDYTVSMKNFKNSAA
ncbi:hypothetical protein [Streptomyces sp. H34-S4]|uniref:hypothetical protein n=1 Tax=Streptomyces sp. H34-S4 TaxID=2996463 RepID=UPI00226EDF04|nr:hypothetical protein [Streptomyces sp. H34-S4]MCY0938442.1 hypothetical protein [Streptomyces sp. H34-S4]